MRDTDSESAAADGICHQALSGPRRPFHCHHHPLHFQKEGAPKTLKKGRKGALDIVYDVVCNILGDLRSYRYVEEHSYNGAGQQLKELWAAWVETNYCTAGPTSIGRGFGTEVKTPEDSYEDEASESVAGVNGSWSPGSVAAGDCAGPAGQPLLQNQKLLWRCQQLL